MKTWQPKFLYQCVIVRSPFFFFKAFLLLWTYIKDVRKNGFDIFRLTHMLRKKKTLKSQKGSKSLTTVNFIWPRRSGRFCDTFLWRSKRTRHLRATFPEPDCLGSNTNSTTLHQWLWASYLTFCASVFSTIKWDNNSICFQAQIS